MPKRSIRTADLRAECALVERAVRSARLASSEEIDPYRPGKEKNPATDAGGWLNFFKRLHRLHARAEQSVSVHQRALADAQVLDALRTEPVPVRLVGRPADAPPLYVYPKSLDALLHVHALDRQLAWMCQQHGLLIAEGSAASLDRLPAVMDAIAYTYRLLAWIVTTPGPAMPYAPDDDRPEPPEPIAALEPWDMVRIVEAHHKHLLRLHALTALIDERRQGDGDGQRPSWSLFIGTMAVELGEDTTVLMKHRALAELLATQRLHSAAVTPPDDDHDSGAGPGLGTR